MDDILHLMEYNDCICTVSQSRRLDADAMLELVKS